MEAKTPRTPRRLRNVAHPEPDHVPEFSSPPHERAVVASTRVTQVLSGDLTEHAGASLKLHHMLAAEEQRIQGELRQSEEMLLRDLRGIAGGSAVHRAFDEPQVQEELKRHIETYVRQKLEAEERALQLTAQIESMRLEADLKVICSKNYLCRRPEAVSLSKYAACGVRRNQKSDDCR